MKLDCFAVSGPFLSRLFSRNMYKFYVYTVCVKISFFSGIVLEINLLFHRGYVIVSLDRESRCSFSECLIIIWLRWRALLTFRAWLQHLLLRVFRDSRRRRQSYIMKRVELIYARNTFKQTNKNVSKFQQDCVSTSGDLFLSVYYKYSIFIYFYSSYCIINFYSRINYWVIINSCPCYMRADIFSILQVGYVLSPRFIGKTYAVAQEMSTFCLVNNSETY